MFEKFLAPSPSGGIWSKQVKILSILFIYNITEKGDINIYGNKNLY
jgi:hypothetical protein